MQGIATLTSNQLIPENPSLTSSDWTVVNQNYTMDKHVGVLEFTSPMEGQHVALLCLNCELTLTEVVIYGMVGILYEIRVDR